MNDDPDNVVNSEYNSINQIQSLKIANKSKSLCMFHINACSLNKNFADLEYLLKCTNKEFNVVTITKTNITRNTSKLCNSSLKNNAVGSTRTESWAGETLLYMVNYLSYKPCNDLNIYNKIWVRTNFCWNSQSKKVQYCSCCDIRHPSIDVTIFYKNYLNRLLDRTLKEEKTYLF